MEVVLALVISLSEVFRNGNYNLYYALSFVFLILNIRNKKHINRVVVWMVPFLLIAILPVAFSPLFSNYLKSFVYLVKIFFCLNLFIFVQDNVEKLNIKEVIDKVIMIFLLLYVFAEITKSSYLWRFNDYVNNFSKTRLQLLYQEPSSLSLICGILIILYLYYIMISNKLFAKENIVNWFRLIFLMYLLYLSAGLSGILSSIFSIIIMFIIFNKDFILRAKVNIKLLFIFLAMIPIGILFFKYGDSIYLRIISVINGQDASFNYRFTISIRVLKELLVETYGFGIGLGNVNTPIGNSFLSMRGLNTIFANSYQYFIAEGGFGAILFILYFVFYCIKRARKSEHNFIKLALLIYIILIQVAGGYFTDPLLWIASGAICSKQIFVFKYQQNSKASKKFKLVCKRKS